MSDALQPAPFVVGVGRSGTTLLRLMLDAHPELAIPPETHFLPELIGLYADGREPETEELVEAVKTHPGWRDFGMDENELRISFAARAGLGPAGDAAGAIRAFYAAYSSGHQKPRWGDKTPVYIESIALIGSVLGDQARFIHLIRDGRDVAVSRGARAVKRGREATPAQDEAKTWQRRIEGARAQATEVDHYLELRYEDLIADPESVLREACEFIEVGFDPAMLDYHERASDRLAELSDLPGKGGKVRPGSERVAAHALTSEPPRADRVERWRTELTADAIAEYEDVAGDLLADLGYPLVRDEQL
ncbi:MAG TPA: sulfotransferase [Solirubrobacterales bacterium]|nr:sulfotransferase [Solirubrobacterales bacterium]